MGTGELTAVSLPGSTILDGHRLEGATLRALTGADELFAIEHPERLDGPSGAAVLLGRCVHRLRVSSGAEAEPAGTIDRLTAGDREALLLRLRQVTFGDGVDLVVSCPDARCGEPMDLELTVDGLCCPPVPVAADVHERYVREGDRPVRFRLPTCGDLEEVAPIALDDPPAAATALAERCTLDAAGLESRELVALLDVAVVELDPQAELELVLTCPACGSAFSSPLDAIELLRRELASRRSDLELGLHLLALHYQWSEADILALPSARRRRYVTTLVDNLATAER